MKHHYLSNMPLDEAVKGYLAFLETAGMRESTEHIASIHALNRVTANAVYAAICSPHYNACAMDGIAVNAAVTFGATETTPVSLCAAKYIPVDTGDPLPKGKDAVIMIEDCIEQADGTILLHAPAAPWQHIRQIGEDISAGDMIVPSYSRIDPATIGAMLAGGVLSLDVLKTPRVGIIPTGDEIVLPNDHPKDGDVMEFNSAIFSGMLTEWGAAPIVYPIVKDVLCDIEDALERAAEECDVVLLGAGTSAGRDDDTATAIENLGEIFCHGIAIKPGKPAVLGRVRDTPVVGVPGYPVSGIIVLEQLVRPVIDRLLMQKRQGEATVAVRLGKAVHTSLKYREFVRATLGKNADGTLSAVPLNRGAGVITSFVKADCILDIPQNCEGYAAGETVQARLLKPLECIKHTVRIVGSHDPLIDEAADELKRSDPTLFVSSQHVGSMGAILALMSGEADMGGVHLLDSSDGRYNVSYIEKYFANGGVALVECVQRVQGLMVQKGNPKAIRSFVDIAGDGISYVNRQKGAGTRLLCDYLLKRDGIDRGKLYGYDREENTHTAVAAQIASGNADVGLGILSAARMYGLDFIPVCNEQYDLLVAESALDTPKVAAFLNVLRSPSFMQRLTLLGGYELDQPGRIRKLWNKN